MLKSVAMAALAGAAACWAIAAPPGDEPIRVGDRLVYPGDAEIPRGLTAVERAYIAEFPLGGGGMRATDPPTGPVWCPGEYHEQEGILISWKGSTSWKNILKQMGAYITTFGGANLYVVVSNATDQSNAASQLSGAGADMARVTFLTRTLDTIWIRDYGPRYIYEGGVRAIVDHVYNRPRPNDDAFPGFYAVARNHAFYGIPLVHGGGNFHLNSTGRAFVTRLINNENPGLTEEQIHGLWSAFQNVDTHFFDPFRSSIDSTQHIDMWVQVIGDDRVVVSDWPLSPGSYEDNICDNAAGYFASEGWTVFRTPAFSVSGTHYTYTNVVLCNDIVLVPTYTNATVSPYNDDALAVWAAAMPGKGIWPVNCQAIVTAAGVMHCIVMHVPESLGAGSPTAYLRTLRGGETVNPGELVNLYWSSDDDETTRDVDLFASFDGGATYTEVIGSGLPDNGAYYWLVPDVATRDARLKVVVHDFEGNEGFDASPVGFVINGSCPADFDHNGTVDTLDFIAFLNAFSAGSTLADMDGNGVVNSLDFVEFLNEFNTGC